MTLWKVENLIRVSLAERYLVVVLAVGTLESGICFPAFPQPVLFELHRTHVIQGRMHRIWLPADRIATIKKFHAAGVPTWVSLEPVIEPETALEIIRKTTRFVDLFKVGRWNYDARSNATDWAQFTSDVVTLLDDLGCDYLIKEDLQQYVPTVA